MDGMLMVLTGKDSVLFSMAMFSLPNGSDCRVIWGHTPTVNRQYQINIWDVSKWFMILSINSHLEYLECVET